MSHVPVLLGEVIAFLNLKENGVYLDATLGEGGHTKAILEKNGAKVIGMDADSEVLKIAAENLRQYDGRIKIINKNFKNLDEALNSERIEKLDGALFDFGMSSFQLDSERGFSFNKNSPLDMRMGGGAKYTARDILEQLSEADIEEMLKIFGEERFAKSIARNICRRRETKTIETTFELKEIIENSIPKKFHHKLNPSTKTFQALRITVNDELNSIKEGLKKVIPFMGKGARLCAISFHSLEDRIVKNFFNEYAKEKGILKIITKKPVTAGEEEISLNPRSRSAKLRAAEIL